jgi:hypothetical protein
MIYMIPAEAQTRLLNRYGIDATLYIGDVLAASEELRSMAPFVEGVDVDDPDTLPDALLDWVALRANELRKGITGPPPASRVKAGNVTVDLRLQDQDATKRGLLAPYLKHKGRVA